MFLKDDSVNIQGIRPELLFAILVTNDIYKKFGQELVITSLNDSKHSKTSLHYAGCAFDARIFYFDDSEYSQVAAAIKTRLGIDYDVIIEKDHLHIEYQPKRRY